MLFRQALVDRASIFLLLTAPCTDSSSIASSVASPTRSTWKGLSTIVPRKLSLSPSSALTCDPIKPPRAMGNVNFLLASYMNGGRMKILLSSGSCDAIADSASRLVVMYLLGRTGAPEAAEMKTNVGTFSWEVSWAKAIATVHPTGSLVLICSCPEIKGVYKPESLFMSSYVNCPFPS